MRQQTFFFTAAATRTWAVDAETRLKLVCGNVNFVVTGDANLTTSYVLSPTEDFTADALLITGNQSNLPIDIPIPKGLQLIVEAAAAGYIQLYLEDVTADLVAISS